MIIWGMELEINSQNENLKLYIYHP